MPALAVAAIVVPMSLACQVKHGNVYEKASSGAWGCMMNQRKITSERPCWSARYIWLQLKSDLRLASAALLRSLPRSMDDCFHPSGLFVRHVPWCPPPVPCGAILTSLRCFSRFRTRLCHLSRDMATYKSTTQVIENAEPKQSSETPNKAKGTERHAAHRIQVYEDNRKQRTTKRRRVLLLCGLVPHRYCGLL